MNKARTRAIVIVALISLVGVVVVALAPGRLGLWPMIGARTAPGGTGVSNALGTNTTNSATPSPTVQRLVKPTIAPWSDSLGLGKPSAPQRWQPQNFDLQIHVRDNYLVGTDPQEADHGSDCGAPPAKHYITTWQDTVFICKDHVMTSIINEGYALIVMTPDHMADWSEGAVTVSWSQSTWRTDGRAWTTVTISPFAEQLALPFDAGVVDLQGMPKDSIQVRTDAFNGVTKWRITQSAGDFNDRTVQEEWPLFDSLITDSKTVRTPLEFTFDRFKYRFRIAPTSVQSPGAVIMEGKWLTPLNFTQGVVQWGDHNYNANKCSEGPMNDQNFCSVDTWHWSNFGISSAVGYLLLKPTNTMTIAGESGKVTFNGVAPPNSYLKFAGLGEIQVSFDGGKTFRPAQKPPMDYSIYHEEHQTNYLTPVPPGTTTVFFRLQGGWYGQGFARDFSIISTAVARAS